jgi:pimeloyl-ACP methyl ester carboxylesterase
MIEHVTGDPLCKRLVIVAHSLGTAVAFDALRSLALRNRALGGAGKPLVQIAKVKSLVTLGSPIDKLDCLFGSTDGRTYREELLRDELLGDLSNEPFFRRGRPRMRWLNFWDRFDPVCDPLFTPLGSATEGDRFRTAMIENVRVVNSPGCDPLTAHIGYLRNPEVITRIYREVFGHHAAVPVPPGQNEGVRWIGLGGFGLALLGIGMIEGALLMNVDFRLGVTVAVVGAGLAAVPQVASLYNALSGLQQRARKLLQAVSVRLNAHT